MFSETSIIPSLMVILLVKMKTGNIKNRLILLSWQSLLEWSDTASVHRGKYVTEKAVIFRVQCSYVSHGIVTFRNYILFFLFVIWTFFKACLKVNCKMLYTWSMATAVLCDRLANTYKIDCIVCVWQAGYILHISSILWGLLIVN